MEMKTLIGGLLIGIPVGAEMQLATISSLYGVIGFGLPADAPGAILGTLGVVSAMAGIFLLRRPAR